MLLRHRTTARSTLLTLLALWVFGGTANAAVPERIMFPVVGVVQFTDDFGDPRGSRAHQGNDIMAKRRAPVVAVEAGRIEKPSWTRSDCLLILHGASGTDYWYLHLNNDLTASNDNAGGCKNGVSYAPGLTNGQRVRAGQLIGYVGNSGNANWAPPHLHFELHPGGGRAISPYPWLTKAPRLLYAVPGSVTQIKLALFGTFRWGEPRIGVRVTRVGIVTGWQGNVPARTIGVGYGDDLIVEQRLTSGVIASTTMAAATVGRNVTIWTKPFAPSLATQLGKAGSLTAIRLRLR